MKQLAKSHMIVVKWLRATEHANVLGLFITLFILAYNIGGWPNKYCYVEI